jgi:hypothetical protein
MVIQTVVNVYRERTRKKYPLDIVVEAAVRAHQPAVPDETIKEAASLIINGVCTSKPLGE